MERRQILLGSGAALATLLAGCSSDETNTGSNSDGPDDEPPADDDTADTGDGATGTDDTEKDKDKTDDAGEDGTDGTDEDKDKTDDSDGNGDIPGLDDELTIDSQIISITDISRDGDELTVVATTTTTDTDVLRDELESVASDMSDAVTDPEAFADAIDRVTWVIKHDGTTQMTFYADTQWVRKYSSGAMSREEFTNRVLETVEQP